MTGIHVYLISHLEESVEFNHNQKQFLAESAEAVPLDENTTRCFREPTAQGGKRESVAGAGSSGRGAFVEYQRLSQGLGRFYTSVWG